MNYLDKLIKRDEIDRYYRDGRDFIEDEAICAELEANKNPDPQRIRDILQKSLAIQTLSGAETAALLAVDDPELLAEMADTALKIKHKVYDNRIVTFAPMYISSTGAGIAEFLRTTIVKRASVLRWRKLRAKRRR